MHSIVSDLFDAALLETCSTQSRRAIQNHPHLNAAMTMAEDDLIAFSEKDPASKGCIETIARTYTSYKAVLHYRLAHAILDIAKSTALGSDDLKTYAYLIFYRGKMLSGAEIHPACRIGKRFVLDHGWGTVIGETCIIGEDCYVLGGVTLGAKGIAHNTPERRHPTLGDRVQVGAFSRVLGNVTIGDDVFIGTHCTIRENIAANSVVSMKTELQITRPKSRNKIDTISSFS